MEPKEGTLTGTVGHADNRTAGVIRCTSVSFQSVLGKATFVSDQRRTMGPRKPNEALSWSLNQQCANLLPPA